MLLKKIFFAVLFSQPLFAQSSTLLLHQLHTLGDAFNIEGGTPFLKLNKHQIWLNLAVVLDRPLVDGKTLHEITTHNPFSLKESSIETYNEAQVNLAFTLITLHYLQHGHTIMKKAPEQDMHLVLYIHRNSSGKKQVKLFQSLIQAAIDKNNIVKNLEPKKNSPSIMDVWYFPEYKTTLEFRIGYEDYMIGNYEDCDIIFSFSLVGGLNQKYPSGSLLIPEQFIPYAIDAHTIYKNQAYSVSNHLHQELPLILEHPEHEKLVEVINRTPLFLSPNPVKNSLRAQKLTLQDFNKATIFQIPKNFNPTDKNQMITILD